MDKKRRGIRAWLIAWEWVGNNRKPDRRFVTLLPPRWPARSVQRIVETLYANSEEFTFSEMLNFVKFPKRFLVNRRFLGDNLRCGDNPWLVAKPVQDLLVETVDHRTQTLHWTVPALRHYDPKSRDYVTDRPPVNDSFTVRYHW